MVFTLKKKRNNEDSTGNIQQKNPVKVPCKTEYTATLWAMRLLIAPCLKDGYAVTDSTGKAVFSDVLIGTGYTLEEVDTAIRYVVPEKQTAAVEWNTVTNKSFTNILKKWNVTVTKSDAETGLPQGDATLAGAVYGIYKGDQLVDTYTTDTNGQFTTKYYVCGDDWTIREITPSEGYLLDSTVYPIGAEAKNYTVEFAMENEKKIKVVLLEPGKLARAAEIDASLAGMQKVVGGLIEPFYPFEEQVCIVCNEESKINGMRPNRSVKNDDGVMVDFIFGPAFICDCRGENLDSLSDEQIDRYGKMFRYPEHLARVNDTLLGIPYRPQPEQER